MTAPPSLANETPAVPYEDVAAFTRALIHDIRNGLNALDLQLAAVLDMAGEGDSPIREDVTVARRLLTDEARRLSHVSAQLRQSTPEMIDYDARDLIEDLRSRVDRGMQTGMPVDWKVEVGAGEVTVDFEFLSAALIEIVRNARQFREGDAAIRILAETRDGILSIDLVETRTSVAGDPASWGLQPFQSTRRGAYGLGLFSARRLLAAIGATLEIEHASGHGELHTRLTLPLVSR